MTAPVQEPAVAIDELHDFEPESYTWVDKLMDDFLDVVIDKAPRWLLIGCAVLAAVGLPFWIVESFS